MLRRACCKSPFPNDEVVRKKMKEDRYQELGVKKKKRRGRYLDMREVCEKQMGGKAVSTGGDEKERPASDGCKKKEGLIHIGGFRTSPKCGFYMVGGVGRRD